MLGEKIGEENGKVIGQRVLAGPVPKMETSFAATGTVLGVAVQTHGTYEATLRQDGTLFGEGQGLLMGNDGSAATWRGNGIGNLKPGGAVSYRGAIYYSTQSPKLARLNGVAAVFEYEVDALGNTSGKIFEWR
jgi:hypothetical protein